MAKTLDDRFSAEYLLGPCKDVCKATFDYHSCPKPGPDILARIDRAIGYFQERTADVLEDTAAGLRSELSLVGSQIEEGFDETKAKGVAILFQNLRRNLFEICNPQSRKEPGYDGGYARAMIEPELPELLKIAKEKGHWLREKDDFLRFIRQTTANAYVKKSKNDRVAAFATGHFYQRYIELWDIVEHPGFPTAGDALLKAFNWWVPHHSKQQAYLTTRPLEESSEREEMKLYTDNGFLAYGGMRDESGTLTHYSLGKLTSEFWTFKKL